MASGLAEIRRGPGLKDRHFSDTAGIRKHKLNLADRYFYEDFKGGLPLVAASIGAGAATTTGVNVLQTSKNLFELSVVGTQTVCYPTLAATGYDFKGDDGATGSEGFELSLGVTASSQAAYTVGTDAFYMKFKVSIADQSGMASMYCGFRLAEAYQAAIASYNTYGAIGMTRVNAATTGDIKIASELDGDANAVVDTTMDFVEGTAYTFGVYVDLGGNFTYTVDGVTPTTTEPNQATAGDVLVPFIITLDHTDTPGATIFREFECGLIDQNVR